MRRVVVVLALAAAMGAAIYLYDRTATLRPALADDITKGTQPVNRFRGKVDAPEFPKDMQWLNTDRPLTLAGLRGKVVLLDFWTFCCINCMHVLPDLKKLERKYPDTLVVIGVHSAKFTAEKDTDNIRQAILRYGIEHPVLNDRDMRVWRSYQVRAWPTLYLIDPEGKIVGYLSGEGVFAPLDEMIAGVIREFDKEGKLKRGRPMFRLERRDAPRPMLAFPGKVLADDASGRLFISDSDNSRIVVASLDGAVTAIIGSGTTGFADGSFTEARFNKPQGLALSGDTLYLADTENHAVRRVDLAKRTVTTLAGTGEQARGIFRHGALRKGVALNSPWDLVLVGGKLYVAMAGPHQLWVIDPTTGEAGPYAGSGREARIDGALAEAALAQPSGITTDGRKLYFADSEVSAVRSADLDARGSVRTIVGVDLFEYGDIDGTGDAVRLQHPLGVVHHDGTLYLADTYNNRIKRVDPVKRTSQTFLGSGEEGLVDGPAATARFDEPGGLSIARGKLYIADTNNHVIRVADLATRNVSTLTLTGLTPPAPPEAEHAEGEPDLALKPQRVAPGKGTLTFSVDLPAGTKLTPGAPSEVRVSVVAGDATLHSHSPGTGADRRREVALKADAFPVEVPFEVAAGKATLHVALRVYYCSDANRGLCYFGEGLIEVPLEAAADATSRTVKLVYPLMR